jgi:hypothetical protein
VFGVIVRQGCIHPWVSVGSFEPACLPAGRLAVGSCLILFAAASVPLVVWSLCKNVHLICEPQAGRLRQPGFELAVGSFLIRSPIY